MKKCLRRILGCISSIAICMTSAANAGAVIIEDAEDPFPVVSDGGVILDVSPASALDELLGSWQTLGTTPLIEFDFREDGSCLMVEHYGTEITGGIRLTTEYGQDTVPARLVFQVEDRTAQYSLSINGKILTMTLEDGVDLFANTGIRVGEPLNFYKVQDKFGNPIEFETVPGSTPGTEIAIIEEVTEDPEITQELFPVFEEVSDSEKEEAVAPGEELIGSPEEFSVLEQESEAEEEFEAGPKEDRETEEELIFFTEETEKETEVIAEAESETEEELFREAELLSEESEEETELVVEEETEQSAEQKPGSLRPDGFYNCTEEALLSVAGLWRTKSETPFYTLNLNTDGSGFLLWYENPDDPEAAGGEECRIRYLTKENEGNAFPQWIEVTLPEQPGEAGYSLYQVEKKNLEMTLTLRKGRNFFAETPLSVGDAVVLEMVSGEDGAIPMETAPDGCFIGYVAQFESDAIWMGIDDVEWISGTNKSRIAELGIADKLMYNFCIYNPDPNARNYMISPGIVVEFCDRATINTVPGSLADLKAQETTWRGRPFEVTIAGNMIVKLAEIYIP